MQDDVNPIAQSTSTLRSLLQTSAYRQLLLSNALWWQALAMWSTTAGWLMFDLTDSAWMVTLLSFWRRTAQLALGFFAGPLGDRLGRRRALLLTQILNLGVGCSLLALFWSGQLTPWFLAGAAFIFGTTWTVDAPARTSLTPDLIGRERITEAMILENFVQSLTSSVGPFIAGWLLALTGPGGCFTALVGFTGLNVVILWRLARQPIPRSMAVQSPPIWQSVAEGVRYVRGNQTILAITLISAVLNILIFPAMSLLPVFTRDVLAQGPLGLGLLNAGYSIGAFAGLILLNWLRRRVSSGWLFTAGAIFECLTLLVFAFSRSYALSWLMLFGAGLGQAGFNAMRSTILLSTASNEMRGRAMSTIVLTQGAGLPGELQSGYLADTIGAPATVGLQSGLAALGTAAVALFLPSVYRPERAAKQKSFRGTTEQG